MASTRCRHAVVSSGAPIARPDVRQDRSLGVLVLDGTGIGDGARSRANGRRGSSKRAFQLATRPIRDRGRIQQDGTCPRSRPPVGVLPRSTWASGRQRPRAHPSACPAVSSDQARPSRSAPRTALSSRGTNRPSVGGQRFVSVGLDRSVPRQIVAVGVDQIDVPPDDRPELVGGELSVGEPHAVGVGRVRGRGKGPLAGPATSELLEEVHNLRGELGRPDSLTPLTRGHHLLAFLAPWPGCPAQAGATRAAGQAARAARPYPQDPG